MALDGSDLTPLVENLDKIVYGLTQWKPKVTTKGLFAAGMISVQGDTYEAAVDKMNQLFVKNGWGDGLPITPPTKAKVDWILTGTDRPRDAIVGGGKILPRGGFSTVESLAIALAMAGGRPEYLPLVIAVVEGMTKTEFEHNVWTATTVSNFPAVVVNGPMAKQIRLPSRYGVIGPDPVHPAGGSIGRAIRFILLDLGGAIPGSGTMGIYGAGRYTNAVFAEDEAGLPKGWPSLAEGQGYKRADNVITMLPVMGAINVQLHSAVAATTEELEMFYLLRFGGSIAYPGAMSGMNRVSPGTSSGIALMGRNMAQVLADHGWTKDKVQTIIEDRAVPSWELLVEMGRVAKDAKPTDKDKKIAPILLVVAGGDQSGQGLWMPSGRTRVVGGAKITLPKNWDALLKQAEVDMGPAPSE